MPNGHVELRHFWHDTETTSVWNRGRLIISAATTRGDDGAPKLT
jgi:hypothetical protein